MREKFITSIEVNSHVIAKRWAKLVKSSQFTKSYHKVNEEELTKIAKKSYINLGRYLEPQTSKTEIGKYYADLGGQRYTDGYPLCEILYSLHFTKRILFDYISSEALLPNTLTLYQANEFMLEITDFFDLVIFYISRGYQEAVYKKMLAQKDVDKNTIRDVFPPGSFYYEHDPDFKSFAKAMEAFNLFKVK
ncbi:MAG: hypothetical protein ACM3SY_21435 [Candidatus Omnitrophota bacterium]